MIQANELRIGNWVKHSSEYSYRSKDENEFLFQWTEMDWYQLGEGTIDLDQISPIPLTPEILEQCGFTKSKWPERYEKQMPLRHYNLYFQNGKLFLDCMDSYYNEELDHIVSLHQLQNLYFTFTGEELEIKILQPS